MYKHASINRAFRLVRNEALDCWVPVAEISRGRRKRSGRPAGLLAILLAMCGAQAQAQQAGVAPPPVLELPTGGNVVAGSAILTTVNSPAAAVLNVDQSTQRAIIDWNTFNVGSAAQVNFNQPNRDAATLNRVLDSNPSQIFGRITSTGQVFLTNANGVYFGKSATADVGSLVATTHNLDNADFLAGKVTLNRNGASGSVTNEGELRAALGGYIALLAPEVRNSGVIVARMGTVVMASGESITLNFDGHHLAGITVEPSAIAALVENKGAVLAPGGLIILSAKALDHLQGGVVNNSGTLEATGLSEKGGRIVLEASDSIDNSGTINANAGVDGSPAGIVELIAPDIVNSGTITASGFAGADLAPVAGGSIALIADNIIQTAPGSLDVSGMDGGSVLLAATENIDVAGSIAAVADSATSEEGQGGNITLAAGHDVTLQNASLDASGSNGGGQILVAAGEPAPSDPPGELPTVALLGTAQLRSASRRGRGGSVKVTGGRVGLFDETSVDATGATGGGEVLVGGGFHGADPSMVNARQVVVGSHATIDASATKTGAGGNVAIWSDGQTTYGGNIAARGGSAAGDGGFVEVSGAGNLDFRGMVDASAAHGAAGTLLLDPLNIIIDALGAATLANVDQFSDTPAVDSTISPNTITAVTNAGTAVVLQANNDITLNSSIVSINPGGNGGALTFRAGRSIILNGSVSSDDGNISFTVNDSGADSNRIAATDAVFVNNSLIDAGDGTLSITMGTKDQAGVISTGQVTAGTFNIAQNSLSGTAASGAIDLGEVTVTGNMGITSAIARNVTNTVGAVIVRGTATISVGTGDVTINRATTDFNFIGLTAGNVTLADTNAMRFTATNLSGNLIESAQGPIAQTGAVVVAGTTNLSVTDGGFGYADPYINLSNGSNNFGGAVTISAATAGTTGTGGYVTLADSNSLTITSAAVARSLTLNAVGAISAGSMTVGTTMNVTSSGSGDITLGTTGTTSVGSDASINGRGAVSLQGVTTVGGSFGITALGAVSLSTTTVNGNNLSINTTGAITDSGAVTVANYTYLWAGTGNDITLDTATNNFNLIQILSGNNVTLADTNAIVIGPGGSTISGNLSVTAGGSISQYAQHDNYAPITVAGTSTFTATAANTDLGMGPVLVNYLQGYPGAQNSFAGAITIATTGAGSWRDVLVKNVNSGAAVINGLGGGLRDVLFFFDNATSISLPAMTLSGNLVVDVPNGGITQTGALVVNDATNGISTFRSASGADIVLTNAGNDFSRFSVRDARDVTVVDANAIDLYASNVQFNVQRNLTVTAAGAISDSSVGNNPGYFMNVGSAGSGTATFTAGSANNIILDNDINLWRTLVVNSANNLVLNPRNSLVLGNVSANGTVSFDSRDGGSLTQLAATAVLAGGTTTFNDFTSGITLAQTGNVLGNLAINNASLVTIRENDAITQASAWTNVTNSAITLTTSDDQAIALTQANYFGNLTLTQINNGAGSAGAVSVTETGDNINGMTQGAAWTLHGVTTLASGNYSINLPTATNVFGALQVTGATGNTGSVPVPSTVTIYAQNTAAGDAIRDGSGAWNTGTGIVKLIAYNTGGTTAGGGNINLSNAGNVLGDLYIKATNATITENDSITDGTSTIWNAANNTGWVTTGTTNLVVANPSGKSITLDNLSNVIGPLGLNMTGTPGSLSSVLITDNTDLTQASVWNVGAAPVTLDARNHLINLSSSGNVLGAITINTTNGMPTSIAITEDDAITQGAAWIMSGVPVTLVAENGKAITLTNASNILGNLTLTGGAVSITENDVITQGAAWTTTGTTTLNATTNTITLNDANNVLGALAISGGPTAVGITENDDITQASAWVQGTTAFTLNAGTHDIVLSQATNQLGDLTLTAANATVTENQAAGITDGSAWAISGNTVLTAGSANAIVLNANPASDFGTVSIVSASNADIADINGINFGASTIAAGGTLTISAGGAITQSGAISAPSLRLIGTGSASLLDAANNVSNLAAGFSGGNLAFTNNGTFAVAVVGGTSGVTIGAHDVTLTSGAGTVTGLSNVNATSTSLTVAAATALTLPQMGIAGAQTYTSGGGITLTAGVTSTAAGAINFMSPVTLGADLSIQSSNSAINFAGTLAGGTNQLTVNAGTGAVAFHGAVSALGNTGDASAALQITSSGASFDSTLSANNGLAITGPVVFSDTVTLSDGNAASVFTGLVTLGRAGGMNLSGYDGMTFNGGVLLQNGAATINSNNSALAFQTAGSVSGPYALTLNSGTASLIGLDRMGANLTSLSVTALSPTIPSGGVTIAGSQSYTATAGSVITLSGNVTSTAAGTISFNSPVTVGAGSIVTTVDSDVLFAGTVNGNSDLTVSAGTGATTFNGAVGAVAALGDGTGAALTVSGTGATTFGSTLQTRSGITLGGAVNFTNNVTLGDGTVGSTFAGLATSGGSSGNSISGFDGLAFNGGLAVVGGAVSVASNGSTLQLGGPVTGAQILTLNALAGGAGTISGLDQIGFASTLTGLNLTAQTLSLPGSGLAVAGAMNFTAAGGITLNGAVGNSSGPATGAISFNGPVNLATGAIAVTTANAAVNFNGTVNGAQTLTVNAGSGVTTFGGAIGAVTALTSLTTDAGGSTALNGGSIRTTGAQTYNDAVTLGADSTLSGVGVQFLGTLNGARALVVNDSGATVFGGLVGGSTALTSITTDAPGTVAVNTTAVTTTAAQTYNENMTLGANVAFNGIGLNFAGIDGAHTLSVNAGSGAANFNGAIGAATPLTSIAATGNTLAVAAATTSGTQAYTASGGVTLNGNLTTTGNDITITGQTTLGADATLASNGGNVVFAGAPSTINGAHFLTLTAGAGDVVLGGVVGGITRLTGINASGNNLTLPGISTVGDLNQTYTALNNITLNQSRNVNAPISFTADSDESGQGSFILLDSVSLTASNNTLAIRAADLDLQGNSTMSSGSGLMSLTASNGRNVALGGADAAGQMTISGSELSRMSSSSGLNLNATGTGWVRVNGITALQSQNITGTLGLNAQGTGDISFITAASTFNALRVAATGGTTNVGVNLTTTNDAIEFVTPVSVSGASTISSGGGNISFDGALAVDNDLTLNTGNGVLTFGGAVGSNRTLTLNLGGGSVAGLAQLQSALTGLTINGTSGITLPALTINGPQVYNTGAITVTGDLIGTGITFNNLVDVAPASGTALTMNAGTGTLNFTNLVSFNATDMSLIGDEINFARSVTGSGSLALRAFTGSRNTAVGGSGAPIVGLNLTAADLGWLPIGTLSSLTIGNASGTGTLDLAGVLNAPGTPVTLNGAGGITQSGGSLTAGNLALYAAGAGISLNSATNAFGAVAINGTPNALDLRNTRDITQLGAAAWVVGAGPVTLNAGTHDITLNNAGNTFGTLVLNGGTVQITESDGTDVGASSIANNLTLTSGGALNISGALSAAGNVALSATGLVTQGASAPLTVGGNFAVITTLNAGDVTVNNSGAAATSLGNTFVGGNYALTATGKPVSQAAGASLQVRGDLTVTGASIVLGGAGNLIGGTTSLPATNTVVLRQSGAITLLDRNDLGNLTVISERTNRSFGSAQVTGDAIVLDNAANNIAGTLSVSASPATIVTGADVQTGITQSAGTSITVAGLASFTAESSSAGSLGINLTNAGNHFGTLQLAGTTVDVVNAAAGLTTIENAVATTSLSLTTAGGLAQAGFISAPTLAINASGAVTLNNAANDANSISVSSGGGAISYVDANGVSVTALNAGGANASLTAGGAGNLSQTGALLNVAVLNANAGGAVTLNNAGNTIGSLGASQAGTGFQLFDSAGGLAVTGLARTLSGDMTVRTSGDFTINSGGRLQADAGNVSVSTESAGNFNNNAGSTALVVGAGSRWLVYSNTPDLAVGAHTVKGGLTSSFRHYGATYGSYAPGAVSESGNGFIYRDAAPTLTVSAAITGTPSHVYGDTPTGSLSYTISAGLLDSEDNAGNVISGGTATYSSALTNTMNAGSYSIGYTGGLTSSYTLVADSTGAAYTVTPALLTYTANSASRLYGASDPSLGGVIGGFKLGQTVTALGGSLTWTTAAVAASNVGQYSISGSGYTSSNYTFAQAAGNASAFNITPAGLTVTAGNDSRLYNGTGYAGGAGVTYSGFANGEGAGVLGGTVAYGGSAQGARNAGTYTIAASGLTSGNYSINYVNGSLSIGRANLTLTPNVVTRTYDGTLSAVGTAAATGGTQLFGTDSVSGGSFAFTDANAGAGNKTVSLAGATVNDGNGGANYTVSYANNTASTINRANLTVASANVVKTYDGNSSALGAATVVSGQLFSNASNGGAADTLSGGSFAFTDPNAGAGNKSVTASGVTLTDGNSGGNYTVTYANNTTSTINTAALTFLGTIARRDYDGTTNATLAGYTLSGFIGSETLTAAAGSAAFVDRNAGTGKTVNLSGISLADGTNGGLASNYQVASTASALGTIDPKLLTLNATVADRTYDGTTNAVVQSYGLSGFAGSETVTGVLTGSARFTDKHVGTDKGISITGIVLLNGTNGGLASNYLAPTSATSSADITAASLQVAGVVALDKVYDGSTIATLDTRSSGVTGVFGSDDVSIGSITGTFLDKNVGADKAIGAGTVVLSGADAGDYLLVQPTGLTASITPRALVVSATAASKVYDATTGATVSLTDNRVLGDGLSITANSSFLDKNVGSGKFVDVTGIAISGTDAGNYTVNDSASASASITRANLSVSATGSDKVYDGSTAASVTLAGAPLAGDFVDLSFESAAFGDKNAGSDKGVSVTGIRATGADAGNYNISSTAATIADITPATLTVVAAGQSKPFDNTTAAVVTLGDDRIAGDQLTLANASALFADAEIGNDKSIAVSGIRIAGGADSGNYVLASVSAATTADITGPIVVDASSTWSLPPVLPQAVPLMAPTAPEVLLDDTLPASFGGGTSESTGEVSVAATLVRASSRAQPGMVSVVVPGDIGRGGTSFSFPLPEELSEAADSGGVRTTLVNGAALPSWVRYVQSNKTFLVTNVPANALPIEVLVQIGKRSWTVLIARPKGH
ncbi:MAG: YDG domain-containing protein [Pseudomonadota bacterium]